MNVGLGGIDLGGEVRGINGQLSWRFMSMGGMPWLPNVLKPVGFPFGCTLSRTSAISAISVISGISLGEFRIHTFNNRQDRGFGSSATGSDQACCVCARPSAAQCGPIDRIPFLVPFLSGANSVRSTMWKLEPLI